MTRQERMVAWMLAALAAGVVVAGEGGAAPPSLEGAGLMLPVQDLADSPETVTRIEDGVREWLDRTAYPLLDPHGLRDAMRRLRIRDAGSASPSQLEALAGEMGAGWFLSVTLHRADVEPLPRLAVSANAFRAGAVDLAWAGWIDDSGLDNRRTFGRGVETTLEPLVDRSIPRLFADLPPGASTRRRRRSTAPSRDGYRADDFDPQCLDLVAVLPLQSLADRDAAAASAAVTELARAVLYRHGVRQVNPASINDVLRKRDEMVPGSVDAVSRTAMSNVTGATAMLTGSVEHYDPATSPEPRPRVAFSLRVIDAGTGRIVWIDGADRTGWDEGGLFGLGRVYGPEGLAREMMESMVAGLTRPERRGTNR